MTDHDPSEPRLMSPPGGVWDYQKLHPENIGCAKNGCVPATYPVDIVLSDFVDVVSEHKRFIGWYRQGANSEKRPFWDVDTFHLVVGDGDYRADVRTPRTGLAALLELIKTALLADALDKEHELGSVVNLDPHGEIHD